MNKMVKNITILIFIIIFIVGFAGSYKSLSIDNLAYVLAIGIDSTDDNQLEVSFQFSNPIPASESGSSEKAKTMIDTVKASSLSTAINLINGYIGKQVNLSHCKIIIFSEEIAMEGISKEVYTLINDTQVRPSANIVISKCNAKYYIEQTQPELETLISKYYEIFTDSSEYTGYMPNATIGDFFFSLTCETCEPFAILGGIQLDSNDNTGANDYEKDYKIKANNAPISGENGSENIGIAVFKSDKLVGELDALETISYLNITSSLERFLISVPDTTHINNYIDVYMSPTQKPKIEVDTSNGSPYIKLKFEFNGRIYSMTENAKYLSPPVIEDISTYCDSYLEAAFSDYLYKTSKDLKADISNLGNYATSNFLTLQEYKDYDWPENYKDAFFDVEVKTSIQSGMLITET